ncbi:hypothetical protein FO519_000870 [Halicephalobus sp. NKZ332]|nr:hypothetical protein FO519_000870 [Halicephalobus sp. NKZ332]
MTPSVRYERAITTVVKKLGEKFTFQTSKRTVKNRLFKGPMSETSTKFDSNDLKSSGIPDSRYVNFYEKWAAGGFGMISTGMTLLDENGRGMFPGNMIIGPDEDSPERRSAFKAIADAVKPHNTILIGQLGNIADVFRYFALEDNTDEAAVRGALKDGIYAAKFFADCGFDGVSVAILPGDFNKNKNFIKDLINYIRKEVNNPSFVVGMKVSTARLQQGGIGVEETFKLIEVINGAGYDFMEVAGGSYEFPLADAADREDRFREIVHGAKKHAPKTAVYIGGGMRRVKVMEKLVADGVVDGICMARPAAAEFDLPLKILGNHIPSTLVLPFEDDMMGGVMAAGAQINQAGLTTLGESNKDVNKGIMNLNDSAVLEKFNTAKAAFVAESQVAKAAGKPFPGVVVVD